MNCYEHFKPMTATMVMTPSTITITNTNNDEDDDDEDDDDEDNDNEEEDDVEDQASESEEEVDETGLPWGRSSLALCNKILRDLFHHKDSSIFLEPVDVDVVMDYYDVVKDPMDLGSMQEKSNRAEYFSWEGFANDARLVFENCAKYNSPDSEEGQAGIAMSNEFERLYKKAIISIRNSTIKYDA
eukprot:m.166219 g.166219  ORF g.166219 m.166219 type:complete len:185 (+) comp31420_c2_seq5:57-611(+)